MKADPSSHPVDRRVSEWLLQEKASQLRERNEASQSRAHHAVITISRQFGAGGHTIAADLVKQLGDPWQEWDKKIIEVIADSAQVRTRMVEALDERTQSWIEQTLSNLGQDHSLVPATYRRHLEMALLAVSHRGNAIVVGRGANFVLAEGLHVRLRASFETRVLETMKRENLVRDAAIRRLAEVDEQRAAFIRLLFNRDVEDPSNYHMVLQTDTLGHAATVAAIEAAYRSRANHSGTSRYNIEARTI